MLIMKTIRLEKQIARQLFYDFQHTYFVRRNLTEVEQELWTQTDLNDLFTWIIEREGDTVG